MAKILLGVSLVCGAYAFITVPLEIVNGGVTSLALILSTVSGIDINFFVHGLTVGILFLCGVFLGRRFFFGSLFSCVAYLWIFSGFHAAVLRWSLGLQVPLWVAVPVAACLVGLGYGLCLQEDATIVGFDAVALILHRYWSSLSVPWTMALINTLVLSSGFFVFGIRQVVAGVVFSWLQAKVLALVYRKGGSDA